jgi:hypothetical protein
VRTLLRLSVPVEKGNQAIKDGSLTRILQATFERLKPEATYFTTLDGKRTALVVFDLEDPSQIPAIAEPLFNGFNGEVELSPVMNLDDLMRGISEAGLA